MASLALLCLACRAAGSTDASEARRLSKEDHRTFRGKLDPPAAGRGRHHVFIHIPKAAGGSWMRASPNWMSRKDTLTGSHEKNAFSPVTLGQLKKGPPGALPVPEHVEKAAGLLRMRVDGRVSVPVADARARLVPVRRGLS
jgi:hypothetical protein